MDNNQTIIDELRAILRFMEQVICSNWINNPVIMLLLRTYIKQRQSEDVLNFCRTTIQTIISGELEE